jgi:hypothetical protein
LKTWQSNVALKCLNNLLRIVIVAFVMIAVSCHSRIYNASASGANHPDSVFASLQRAPCFGRCPAFTAVIYNNGTATYEGRSSVGRQGFYKGNIGTAEMKAILKSAEDLKIDTLQDEYINRQLADFPSHGFSILINGKLKQVYVSDTDPPSVINEFEKILEETIEKIPWTKVEIRE